MNSLRIVHWDNQGYINNGLHTSYRTNNNVWYYLVWKLSFQVFKKFGKKCFLDISECLMTQRCTSSSCFLVIKNNGCDTRHDEFACHSIFLTNRILYISLFVVINKMNFYGPKSCESANSCTKKSVKRFLFIHDRAKTMNIIINTSFFIVQTK